jgi:hypothetical protein
MRSSKYSLKPTNMSLVRAGRTARVSGGDRSVRLNDVGDRKLIATVWRVADIDMHVAIVSGEM